jgi:hypothetical protein
VVAQVLIAFGAFVGFGWTSQSVVTFLLPMAPGVAVLIWRVERLDARRPRRRWSLLLFGSLQGVTLAMLPGLMLGASLATTA